MRKNGEINYALFVSVSQSFYATAAEAEQNKIQAASSCASSST